MFGTMISNLMIKPGKSPVFDNPKNYDLEYEDVSFKAEDGVTLRGWLIKGNTDKVIIQSHFGVQCSRSGYTPKGKGFMAMSKEDVSFLRQAKYLNDKGYTVLMYDFRNHGESDAGTTPWVSWGPEEAKDVIAAVDYISTHKDYKNAKIGLLSICMGSSATTYAYGRENGLKKYKNIKAMISVQPLHYSEFVAAMGMPSFLRKAGEKVTLERTGWNMNDITFMPNVKDINVPTLVIQNKNDPWTKIDFVKEFYNNLTVKKDMLWVQLDKNRGAAYDFIGSNPDQVYSWFDENM